MNKRLLLSLTTIILTVAGLTGATLAFFSQGKVLAGNTFSVGSVSLGSFNYTSLNLTNLLPGVEVTVPNFAVEYTGTTNGDLYMGARGNTSTPADYLADKLYLKIYKQGTSTLVWQGYTNALSTAWQKIADNTAPGWQAYDLKFTLDNNVDNTYQGKMNTNTEILIYAVQTGSPAPTTEPYLTTGTDWL